MSPFPAPAPAFSVLAHQAVVDGCWEDTLVPALHARFPDATPDEIEHARAYAYGGSHVPDLGYFPLGNVLFTNLGTYVRSGDFVGALLREARTVDEYAFALGVLSHYIADDPGHPEVTNRVVAEIYRNYASSTATASPTPTIPGRSIQTEFRFDVLQVALERT